MAEAFATHWLTLREAADARARENGLDARLAAALAGRRAGSARLTVLDLGAGAGNNMRWLAPRLGGDQTWVLVDADRDLLEAAERAVPPRVVPEPVVRDLAEPGVTLAERAVDLVTASALFDLAGAAWIETVADAVAAARVPLLAALSYDGRQSWAPAHPLDAAVIEAFDADQTRDKGLGPALGPAAHGRLAAAMRARGFAVVEADSAWTLTAARDAALIAALAEGTAAAVAPRLGEAAARDWAAARQAAERVEIGHRDLLALPPA